MTNDPKLDYNQDQNQDLDDYAYEPEPVQEGKSSKEKWIIIGAIIVAVIVLAFMYFSKNKSTKQEEAVIENSQMNTDTRPNVDPNAVEQQQLPLQPMPTTTADVNPNIMVDVPAAMPKLTNPTTNQVTIKDPSGRDIDPFTYEGQQVIHQFNAANSATPIYIPNTPAPVNPNSALGLQQQAAAAQAQQNQQILYENTQLKAQVNSLRDVAQRQHITIGQLQTLVKNTRANMGSNVVTLRETKQGASIGKALPQGQEVVATVGNRVWLSDGKNMSSYAIGDKLSTGYRVLDVNEQAGEVSFAK